MRYGVLVIGCVIAAALVRAQETALPDTARLQQMAARFAPTDIVADVSKLSPADRRVLGKLVEASKIIDSLFLRQVWAGNEPCCWTSFATSRPGLCAAALFS
jgi:hypothetical protein